MIVEDFPIKETGTETPHRILKAALETWEGLDDVVVIGNVAGKIWVSGTSSEIPHVLGLIELGKHKLLIDSEDEL